MAKGKCGDPMKEAERARKISETRKRKIMEGTLSIEAQRARSAALRIGVPLSEEHRANIGAGNSGRTKPAHVIAALHAGRDAIVRVRGPANASWKEKVGYSGIHMWIRREFGTPSICEECGVTDGKKFEWANKSGEYKRDRGDWLRLCTLCHRRRDRAKAVASGWVPWNKGMSGGKI